MNGPVSSGNSLERLWDVKLTGIANGDRLTFNASIKKWINSPAIPPYTDEQAQDAVGTILTDSASINFTYDDVANTITAIVIPGGVDHGTIAGLGDNDHPQYLLASSYTAADVLAKLLTVDGAGSGLDADLLDGQSSAAFSLSGHTHDTLANVATSTILGRITAGSGFSEELTPAQVRTLINVEDGATAGPTMAQIAARVTLHI